MTTVGGLTTAEPFEPGASPTGDKPGGGAGKCGGRSIRCEPTPVPTAGEKIRSSSSLGSKSGCLRLDRDPLGIWCFCCCVCLYSISLKKLQQPGSCCLVVLKRFALWVQVHEHFMGTGGLANTLVSPYRIENRYLILLAQLLYHLHHNVGQSIAAVDNRGEQSK